VFADRIISKTIWPPRSSDLSLFEFFFSGVRWKTQCIRTIPTQLMSWRWPSQNTIGMRTVLYWTRSSRTQFVMSINVWRPAGDTLNITCYFLYCNHQVNRDFWVTLYYTIIRSFVLHILRNIVRIVRSILMMSHSLVYILSFFNPLSRDIVVNSLQKTL